MENLIFYVDPSTGERIEVDDLSEFPDHDQIFQIIGKEAMQPLVGFKPCAFTNLEGDKTLNIKANNILITGIDNISFRHYLFSCVHREAPYKKQETDYIKAFREFAKIKP